jgi:hypothetical protein
LLLLLLLLVIINHTAEHVRWHAMPCCINRSRSNGNSSISSSSLHGMGFTDYARRCVHDVAAAAAAHFFS